MAVSPILTDLDAAVTRDTAVKTSAAALIRGISALVQKAVDAALANGATAAELAPVASLVVALNTSTDDLSSAVIEHTPAEA